MDMLKMFTGNASGSSVPGMSNGIAGAMAFFGKMDAAMSGAQAAANESLAVQHAILAEMQLQRECLERIQSCLSAIVAFGPAAIQPEEPGQ
jgi:hypothetical protein